MKSSLPSRLLCVAGLALVSVMTRASALPYNVNVRYKDPQQFTEAKRSFGMHRIHANDYLQPLKAYIDQRASCVLAPGQRLDIEVTDVDLAGEVRAVAWAVASTRRAHHQGQVPYLPRIHLDSPCTVLTARCCARAIARYAISPSSATTLWRTRTRCVTRNP